MTGGRTLFAARRADGLATSEALEILNDAPTNFRPLRPKIDAAMILKELLPFAQRKGE